MVVNFGGREERIGWDNGGAYEMVGKVLFLDLVDENKNIHLIKFTGIHINLCDFIHLDFLL